MSIVERLSGRTNYTKNFINILKNHYSKGSVFLEVERDLDNKQNLTVLVLTEKTIDLATFKGLDATESMSWPIDLKIESHPLSRVKKIQEDYFTPRLAEEGTKQSSRINFSLEFLHEEKLEFSLLKANIHSDEIFPDFLTFIKELKTRIY